LATKERIMKGMLVNVFKCSYGSCGGELGGYDTIVLISSPNFSIPALSEPKGKAVAIMRKYVGGKEFLAAYPVIDGKIDTVGRCFSGTFIYSSDSRFPFDYPIPMHDRKE
jgi:hypothetical protein